MKTCEEYVLAKLLELEKENYEQSDIIKVLKSDLDEQITSADSFVDEVVEVMSAFEIEDEPEWIRITYDGLLVALVRKEAETNQKATKLLKLIRFAKEL